MNDRNHPELLQSDLQFSHLGFHTTNLELMADFYKQVLSFTQTDRGQLGAVNLIFLSRDPTEHHQIVLMDGRPQDNPYCVINQISFRVPHLSMLRKLHDRVKSSALASDLVSVTHGNAISIYFRDPEKNRIEVFMDTPWYCEQPLREVIDLSQSDEQIMETTKRIAVSIPNFQDRETWIKSMKQRMGYE